MLHKTLTQIGGALLNVVGPVHDAVGAPDGMKSEQLLADGSPCKEPLQFYVGGTALVVAGLTALAIKGGKRKAPRRRRTTARRRRTYRRR